MGKRVAGREATDRQRIDAIVAILKKSVFTDDQTAAFAELDALANGIDSISFNASSHKFTNLGDTFTLSVVTDPAGKTAQVTWSSNNASVATVNNGVVTAVADGTATITATTTDGKVAVCNIKVQTIVVNSITLNKTTTTLNGNGATETLTATIDPANYPGTVNWSSSDTSKVTVAKGVLTAVANTVANSPVVITAEAGGKTATCQVTVTGVLQTFHVSVGTLSNVALEDGQGNAITNGQAVLEGSSLTVKLIPAASHQITTASVTMRGAAQTLTDNQDGSKSVALTVDGDIAISASATYVEKDLIDDAVKVTSAGIIYDTAGVYRGSGETNYDCFIVPLEFGKRYKVTGYDWASKNGISGGFNTGLVKEDGNGGYTNLLAADLIETLFANNNNHFSVGANIYKQYSTESFTFATPLSSEAPGIDKIYLAINSRFSSVDISEDISIKELRVLDSYDADTEINGLGFYWSDNYILQPSQSQSIVIVRAEKGATYSYSGFDTSGSNPIGFAIGLCLLNGSLLSNIAATDFKSGSDWLNNDTYFSHATNIVKHSPSASGQFIMPNNSDIDGDIAIVFSTRLSGKDTAETIILTKIS